MDNSSPGRQVRVLQKSFMNTSWITLSFSSWLIFRTRCTSSLAVTCLIWASSSLTSSFGPSSLVVPLQAWLALSGQSRLMCPFLQHLKHLPSCLRVALSSSVRAARARVCPGVRSMAFGFFAKPRCHCCLVGRWLGFRGLKFFRPPK